MALRTVHDTYWVLKQDTGLKGSPGERQLRPTGQPKRVRRFDGRHALSSHQCRYYNGF